MKAASLVVIPPGRLPAHLGSKQAIPILLKLRMTCRSRSSEVRTGRAIAGTVFPPAEDNTTRPRR